LLNTALRFCRATETPVRLVSLVAVDDARRLDAAQQHAQRALDQAKDFLPDDVPVSSQVATGPTVEEAVDKLGWRDGDMIMVGSSRLAQPRRLFLGSTAAKMLRRAGSKAYKQFVVLAPKGPATTKAKGYIKQLGG